MDDEAIEIASDWQGDVGSFVTQLSSVGFIDGNSGCYQLHDWCHHNPWACKAEDRSDSGRLNKLAVKFPCQVEKLKENGVKGVTKSEYRSYIEQWESEQKISKPQGNPKQTPSQPLTPAPTPTPTPTSNILEVFQTSVGQDCPTVPGSAEEPEQEQQKPDPIPYSKIISHLNTACGCQYKASSRSTKDKIKARWNEGFRLQDFVAVIDFKFAEWAGDDKMCRFLRPETLFGTKFEGYLIAARKNHVNGREIVTEQQDQMARYDKKLKELLNGENPFKFAEREGLDELHRLQGLAQEAAALPN
jgi:uncharacterized phage protein (TIGR02220 family)